MCSAPEVERRYWDPAGIANARICHSLVGCGQNYTCYTIYTRELLHSPPLLSYYHAPPDASSPALTPARRSPPRPSILPGVSHLTLAHLHGPSLTSLPSLARDGRRGLRFIYAAVVLPPPPSLSPTLLPSAPSNSPSHCDVYRSP